MVEMPIRSHGHPLAMERKSKPGSLLGLKTFEPAAARAFGAVVRDNRQILLTTQGASCGPTHRANWPALATGQTGSGSPRAQ